MWKSILARLWSWRTVLLYLGLGIGFVVGFAVWSVTKDPSQAVTLGTATGVFLNLVSVYRLTAGVIAVIRLGWKEAEVTQREREERATRLIALEKQQRENLGGHLRNHVENVTWELATDTPHMMVEITVYNLSVFAGRMT